MGSKMQRITAIATKTMAFSLLGAGILTLSGCYKATSEALTEVVQDSRSLCPYKSGFYNVKEGHIDGGLTIATIAIGQSRLEKNKDTTCRIRVLSAQNKSTQKSIEEFFKRKTHDLDNGFKVSYAYPIEDKPNIYYIRQLGRLYEVFADCTSDINGSCPTITTAEGIKSQTKYFVSTERQREKLLKQAGRELNNPLAELALTTKIQMPTYIITPRKTTIKAVKKTKSNNGNKSQTTKSK